MSSAADDQYLNPTNPYPPSVKGQREFAHRFSSVKGAHDPRLLFESPYFRYGVVGLVDQPDPWEVCEPNPSLKTDAVKVSAIIHGPQVGTTPAIPSTAMNLEWRLNSCGRNVVGIPGGRLYQESHDALTQAKHRLRAETGLFDPNDELFKDETESTPVTGIKWWARKGLQEGTFPSVSMTTEKRSHIYADVYTSENLTSSKDLPKQILGPQESIKTDLVPIDKVHDYIDTHARIGCAVEDDACTLANNLASIYETHRLQSRLEGLSTESDVTPMSWASVADAMHLERCDAPSDASESDTDSPSSAMT